MWIRRIAVAHWRGLEDLELADLDAGLNLIAGPNESGKSRLVQALRFALFESTKGKAQHKKDLESWGVAPEKPRVELDFDLGGESWQIEKVFLGTGTNTLLRGGRERLEGEEAEARLASMLGVGEPGTTGLKDEDAGIWPLLWVNQGDSFASPTARANDDAQRRIQDTLTDEVGEVAAGERGQQLLARAQELSERHYTPGRGAEKKPLTDARERVEKATRDLEQARGEREAIARDAERLHQLREQDTDLAERVREAAARLEAVKRRREAARSAREKLRLQEQQVTAAETALAREREQYQRREQLARALATRQERVEELDRALIDAGDRRTAVRAEADVAAEQAEAAQTGLSESMRALTALRQRAERTRAREELSRLRTRMEAIARLRGEIRELQDARTRLPDVSAETLAALRELRDRVGAARARLEGASASVAIHAEQDLQLDGETLSAGSERTLRIDDDRDIDLGGIARITIHPGGGELPRLRDGLRDAEAAFAERLEAPGVAGLPEAEQALEQRRELDRELATRKQDLDREAPDGIEALEQMLRETEARLGDPGAEAASATGEDEPEREDAPVTAGMLAEAEQVESRARDALETARARRDAVRERLQEAGTEVATLEARLADARTEQAEQQRQLEAQADAEALAKRIAKAEEHWQTQLALREQARKEYESLGGDDLELDVERAEKAHAQLRDQHRANENEIIVLQDRLRSAGDAARHERVQELEAELEQARTALARMEREAGAARRLYEVLDSAAREARERLTQPVIERIRPYLADLFPGSEVWLGEELDLVGLRGSEVEEPFDDLSGGAREQLSLLVRIGLAEVLGAEEPWPLVLDDALVNTDPERIRRVQRLLYQASRRMQILLFTCHGALFDELGPDRRVELAARPRS